MKLFDTNFFGFAEPAKGLGTLQFDVTAKKVPQIPKFTLRLRLESESWHLTGLQPFVWDYLPPLGKRTYPIIRIVASRNVEIVSEFNNADAPYDRDPLTTSKNAPLIPINGKVLLEGIGNTRLLHIPITKQILPMPANYGRYAISYTFDQGKSIPRVAPWLPMIQIIRPQHYGVMPNPDSRIKIHDLIIPSFVLSPQLSVSNKSKKTNRTVRVSQHPAGVIMQQIQGKYRIDIRIKNPQLPAAFWYEFIEPESSERNFYAVKIVYSKNVNVKVEAKEGMRDKVAVFAARVDISRVPFQGEQLDESLFKKVNNGFISPKQMGVTDSIEDVLADVLDTALGAIPIVGEIYDISQFAYAAATGEDFWGRDVSKTELSILGSAVLLPFGLKMRG